jgi:hypothetical protein
MSIATHVTVQAQDQNGNPLFDREGRPVPGVVINPAKPFVRAYWIPGTGPDGSVAVTLAANGSALLDFVIDDQGHFDWKYLMGDSDGEYVLQFFDVGKNRELQNRPVPASLIVGSAQRPFVLPESYFFNVGDSQRNLRCKITDISGSQNVVRLALHGRRFYHKDADPDVALAMRKYFGQGEKPYSYFLVPLENDPNTGAPPTLPALGTLTLTLQSDAGADTELKKWMASSTGAFEVNIFDRSKNKFLMNDFIPSNDIFGNAEFPFIPADSYLLERQKYLIFYLRDLSGQTNTVYIAAAGRRLQLIP